MTPLLQQFISEGRDFLQSISEKLMALENHPSDAAMMGELFRLVHTLKGNSGLFDFPEMSRVLHAAEDVMVVVRDGDLPYSQLLADRLLDAMDFVSMLMDEMDITGTNSAIHAQTSSKLAETLRSLIAHTLDVGCPDASVAQSSEPVVEASYKSSGFSACDVPESLRMALFKKAKLGSPLFWVRYQPEAECFFKGEDPFFQARQSPGFEWAKTEQLHESLTLDGFDPYQCTLIFSFLSSATKLEIEAHFRYVPEQVSIIEIDRFQLVFPVGDENGGPVYEDFIQDALENIENGNLQGLERATRSMLELSSSGLWFASVLRWLLLMLENDSVSQGPMIAVIESLRTFEQPVFTLAERAAAETIEATPHVVSPAPETSFIDSVINAQLLILGMPDEDEWLIGRIKAVASTLMGCFKSSGHSEYLPSLDIALSQALLDLSSKPLLVWLSAHSPNIQSHPKTKLAGPDASLPVSLSSVAEVDHLIQELSAIDPLSSDSESKPLRRSEDTSGSSKTLKVDQEKIDRLMNLIGEMVVAKNGLPYLAARAETVFGVRELSREIKNQYAVINRIAEEMQDAIMLVRMLPVSFVFQRFPRLVRDISRKLGKEVHLILEGEATEADKNIIEALADPLIHIVRNSLDHGLELPNIRLQLGKPAVGRLIIRASQEAGRVIIDISDDGKGIDPAVIKLKAYEKGLIDETTLGTMTDQEAINLVFAAGFSTADVVSDLSGRGVGMDVVRTAVERVNGTVTLQSRVGEGTTLRMSLPLSMAVTNVMIIESNQQIFGVPMDMVVETVRIRRSDIHNIKNHQTAVLRGRIIPLFSLNELLATHTPQQTNEDDEIATLVIRFKGENVGIVVDDFREVVDIILKPLGGILGGLPGYTGSALLGDGSVLMVLNLTELL